MRDLKEWREHRNLSREDLAERAGFPVEAIERWEEVGFDVEPGSRGGDVVVNRLMNVLDAGEGMRTKYVPDAPESGDLVITPAGFPGYGGAGGLVEEILEHSEELNVRMFVPDEFGGRLVNIEDFSDEDDAAIQEHFDREARHAGRMLGRIENLVEMLGGDSGAWKEGQTAGERMGEMGRELDADLGRRGDVWRGE